MHDLEKRIEQWRRGMRTKLGSEAIEELESHLRDAVEGFLAPGRSETEAFDLAVKRLGSADEISAEFEKRLGTWWAITAARVVALVGLLGLCALAVAIGSRGGPMKWLLAAHVFTITAGYLATFMIGGLGICYVAQRMWQELSPTAETRALRSVITFATAAAALTAVGVGLGMIWAKIEWGRFWTGNYREIGGLAIFTWLLLFIGIGRARLINARGMMLMALVGNIIVLFGWFAAYSWDMRQWDGLRYAMIGGGTTFHLIMVALGFAPAGSARLGKA